MVEYTDHDPLLIPSGEKALECANITNGGWPMSEEIVQLSALSLYDMYTSPGSVPQRGLSP